MDVPLGRLGARRHRVGLLGLGVMGARHARVLGELAARFEIVGGYDPRTELATPGGVPRLDSERDVLERADVVVVATPIETHHDLVARALEARRRVFVEKPLGATAAEARALAGSPGAEALFVGHTERFNPVVRALVRLTRGEPVRSIELVRVAPSRPSPWGVLLNLGVHDLDLAGYLGGARVTVQGARGSDHAGALAADFAEVSLRTSRGTVVRVYVDRTAASRRRHVRIVTAQWAYDGDLLTPRLTRTPASTAGGPAVELPLVLKEPLVAQAEALADALDGRPSNELASASEGAAAVELAETAAASCAGRAGRYMNDRSRVVADR